MQKKCVWGWGGLGLEGGGKNKGTKLGDGQELLFCAKVSRKGLSDRPFEPRVPWTSAEKAARDYRKDVASPSMQLSLNGPSISLLILIETWGIVFPHSFMK